MKSPIIPKIPEQTCSDALDVIPKEAYERKKQLYTELDRIERVNPQIAQYLRRSNNTHTKTFAQNPDELIWAIWAGVLVFDLLETVMKVPEVTKDTYEGFIVEHRRAIQTGGEVSTALLEELARDLKEENKFLLVALHQITGHCKRNDAQILVFYIGVVVYKLIKAKLEADILEKRFFPET